MKVQSEIFKGIEFVRISSLPGDQREEIWGSFQHEKIIKIVKDQALMNDCILYHDYVSWLKQHQASVLKSASISLASPQPAIARLAFK